MKRRDFPALTGLRFFLALWVILHHLTGPGQRLEATALLLPHPLFTLIRGGYQAVTTFFVLSGFVLTRSYAATVWNRRNTLRYAVGRAARVYPVYLLSLLMVAPFIAADATPGKAGYLAAHLLLVQAWLGAIPVNWNTPGVEPVVRDVFLRDVPAGGGFHPRGPMARGHRRGGRGGLPHACDVGRGSVGQHQTAGAPERFSDGHRGRLRLRSAAAARASAPGLVALRAGIAGRGGRARVSRMCCPAGSI